MTHDLADDICVYMKEEKKLWPSWRYGPNGESAIFERESDVPEGWTNNPNDFKKEEKPAKVAKKKTKDAVVKVDTIKAKITAETPKKVNPSSN